MKTPISKLQTPEPPITKGDKVSFVRVRKEGHGFKFSAREGIVVDFNDTWVQVRYRGRTYDVARADVRAAGEKNALTEALENAGDITAEGGK